MTGWRTFLRSTRGASAAEFALVLPAALLVMLGTIDVGRWAWTLNELEKATQAGARHAVVTSLVASGLNEADFGDACGTLQVGQTISCKDAFPDITCTGASCGCGAGGCGPVDPGFDSAAFAAILGQVHRYAPYVAAENLTVTYSPSGIGFYGDPACLGERTKTGCDTGELADVAPIVTVRIASLQFQPITFGLFGGGITLPARSYSLTLEDGVGSASALPG